jgi:hypothetical protein
MVLLQDIELHRACIVAWFESSQRYVETEEVHESSYREPEVLVLVCEDTSETYEVDAECSFLTFFFVHQSCICDTVHYRPLV